MTVESGELLVEPEVERAPDESTGLLPKKPRGNLVVDRQPIGPSLRDKWNNLSTTKKVLLPLGGLVGLVGTAIVVGGAVDLGLCLGTDDKGLFCGRKENTPTPPSTTPFSHQINTQFPNTNNNRSFMLYKDSNDNVAEIKSIKFSSRTNITSQAPLPPGMTLTVTKVAENNYQCVLATNSSFAISEIGTDILNYTAIPGADFFGQFPGITSVSVVLADNTVIDNVPVHNAVSPNPVPKHDVTASFTTFDAGWVPHGFPAIPAGATTLELVSSSINFDQNGRLQVEYPMAEAVILQELNNIQSHTGKHIRFTLPANANWATWIGDPAKRANAANDFNKYIAMLGKGSFAFDISQVNIDSASFAAFIKLLNANAQISLIVSPFNKPSKEVLSAANGYIVIDPKITPAPLAGAQQNIDKPAINDPTRQQVGDNTITDMINYLTSNGVSANKIVTTLSGFAEMMPVASIQQGQTGYGSPLTGASMDLTNTCVRDGIVCPEGLNINQRIPSDAFTNPSTAWAIGTLNGKQVVASSADKKVVDKLAAKVEQNGLGGMRIDRSMDDGHNGTSPLVQEAASKLSANQLRTRNLVAAMESRLAAPAPISSSFQNSNLVSSGKTANLDSKQITAGSTNNGSWFGWAGLFVAGVTGVAAVGVAAKKFLASEETEQETTTIRKSN